MENTFSFLQSWVHLTEYPLKVVKVQDLCLVHGQDVPESLIVASHSYLVLGLNVDKL